MINTDWYLHRGVSHRITEDYVVTNSRTPEGQIFGPPYVALADGCSTAPRTDCGARILAQAAKVRLYDDHVNDASMFHGILQTARTIAEAQRYPVEALSATLLSITLSRGQIFRMRMVGDGVFAVKLHTGHIQFKHFEFLGLNNKSAPYYLRYQLSIADRSAYFLRFGHDLLITEYHLNDKGELVEKESIHRQFEVDSIKNQPFHFEWDVPAEAVQVAAVMSDGVDSFVDPKQEPEDRKVPIHKIVSELMQFKQCHGDFVDRRARRAFKLFDKQGWRNIDDVSIGAIAVTKEEEQ